MPELKKLGYAVSTIQFDPAMDSSEMGPESWMKIVKIIADNYQLYDGFCRASWYGHDVFHGICFEFYAGKLK